MKDYNDIDALKDVEEALSKIGEDDRKRILNWVCKKYLNKAAPDAGSGGIPENPPKPKKKTAKAKSGRKPKANYKLLKDLNLRPAGKIPAADFISEKKPTSLLHKCVTALYYLIHTLEIEQVSVDHIYTFYKFMQWPVPSNLPNTLQQSGTKGWLDTSNSSDIKITHMGENLVGHELPAKSA